jgi:hypothetical protein
VYAFARAGHTRPHDAEAVDGSSVIESVERAGLAAFYTPVPLRSFSQEAIDERSGDLEWLGAIGYRHQGVMQALMHDGTVLPLRAFTLFVSEETLAVHLEEHAAEIAPMLERLDGKEEWTFRVEIDPQRWESSLANRVAAFGELQQKVATASPGHAFLLRKKLDEEKKRASREAELALVIELEQEIVTRLSCDTLAESRIERGGAFPQISALVPRDEETRLQELHRDLLERYDAEGVAIALTGPWPPYSFAVLTQNG